MLSVPLKYMVSGKTKQGKVRLLWKFGTMPAGSSMYGLKKKAMCLIGLLVCVIVYLCFLAHFHKQALSGRAYLHINFW
jgi:hypothetical protein